MPGTVKIETTPTTVMTEAGQGDCNLLEKVKEKPRMELQSSDTVETGDSDVKAGQVSSPVFEKKDAEEKVNSSPIKAAMSDETVDKKLEGVKISPTKAALSKDKLIKASISPTKAFTVTVEVEKLIEVKCSPPNLLKETNEDENSDKVKSSLKPAVASIDTKEDEKPDVISSPTKLAATGDEMDELNSSTIKASTVTNESVKLVGIKSSPSKPAELMKTPKTENSEDIKTSPSKIAVAPIDTKGDRKLEEVKSSPKKLASSEEIKEEHMVEVKGSSAMPSRETEDCKKSVKIQSPLKLTDSKEIIKSVDLKLDVIESSPKKNSACLEVDENEKLSSPTTNEAQSMVTVVDEKLVGEANSSPRKHAVAVAKGKKLDNELVSEATSSLTKSSAVSQEADEGNKVEEDISPTEPPAPSDMIKLAECPVKSVEEGNEIAVTAKTVQNSPLKSEAYILLAQGKRHLMVKDYSSAVNSLESACSKLSELYGEFANECADAYYAYGRALLELVREESAVLGNAVENKDEKSDEEDEEDGDEEQEEVEERNVDNKDGDKAGDEVEDKDNEKMEVVENGAEIAGSENDEEKEEEACNLQIAWEILELARNIYESQNNEAKVAETYLLLGEVGLESASYATAIEDMKKSLEIKKRISPPESREIAQTLFQLGIACSLCNQFEEAIDYYSSSSEIIESRMEQLVQQECPDAENAANPFYTVEKEIDELKALLPIIKEKITDMEDYKAETMKAVMEATGKVMPVSAGEAGPSSAAQNELTQSVSAKPAADISHLVRKKRKPEDLDTAESQPCLKQACIE